jgi:hypothetical protein
LPDWPVQHVTKVEFVINLKSATIPLPLLALAERGD